MEGCVFHKVPMSAAIFRRLKDVGGGPILHNVMVTPGIFVSRIVKIPRVATQAGGFRKAA